MQLVIEISDGLYNNLDEIKNGSIASKIILNCVRKGKILPKGHGRLIDANRILNCKCKNSFSECDTCMDSELCALLNEVPTVIEAEKES